MASFADAIKPLGDYDKYIHLLIAADAGFGKTVFAGTAGPKCLFLTTDPEGTISARMFGSEAMERKIATWTEFSEGYTWLKNGGIAELGIEWLVIDNISEAQNLAMVETMELARKRNTNRDEFVPGIDDHQRSQIMIRTMVKKFHDLPVNVIWTSWLTRLEDKDGEEYFAPAIHGQQGALAQTIAGYMNVVAYGLVEDDERVLYFSHSGSARGKDRFNVLGKSRKDLTVPKLQALIAAAIKKANASSGSKPVAAKAPIKKPVAARRPVTPRKKA